MRYRLVPTRQHTSLRHSWFIEGEQDAAITSAQAFFEAEGIPVLVCEAPLDGIVRRVQQVGKRPKKIRRAA